MVRPPLGGRHEAPSIEVRAVSRREAVELAWVELLASEALHQRDGYGFANDGYSFANDGYSAANDDGNDEDQPKAEFLPPLVDVANLPPQLIDAWIALELDSLRPRPNDMPVPRSFDDLLLERWLRREV